MPELSIVHMQMCKQNEYVERDIRGYRQVYDPRFDGWSCTCKGFTYRKTCKHIKQAEDERCIWHEQHGEINQPDLLKEQMKCPICGGPTVIVQVGV